MREIAALLSRVWNKNTIVMVCMKSVSGLTDGTVHLEGRMGNSVLYFMRPDVLVSMDHGV